MRVQSIQVGLDMKKRPVLLAFAEADALVAENQTTHSVLVADADGTVIGKLGEPGQVVSAG